MHVLVTGGAGYIGSHTVKALTQKNHQVTIFDSLEHGHAELLKPFIPTDSLIQGDIQNQTDLDRLFEGRHFDAIMHFAAYIEAGESVKDPSKFFLNNTAGTLRLLDTAIRHGVKRFIFSSTAAVYGEPTATPIPEGAITQPTNPYGTSKLLIEKALADLARYTDLRVTVLRYFNASGADLDGQLGELHQPETHLIPRVLDVAAGKTSAITLFGTDYPTPDGTAIRDYIHVSDLASAHIAALEKQDSQQQPFAAYNIGTSKGYSVREIISIAEQVTGKTIAINEQPRRIGDPAILVADAQKIAQDLDWQPQHSDLEAIISTAWQWHLKHLDS